MELNGLTDGNNTDFTITGGTLDINANFDNNGDLSFSGGTITVAVDKIATFAELP